MTKVHVRARQANITTMAVVGQSYDVATLEEALDRFRRDFPAAQDVVVSGIDHTRAEWQALTGTTYGPEYTFRDDDERRQEDDELRARRKHWPWSLFWSS